MGWVVIVSWPMLACASHPNPHSRSMPDFSKINRSHLALAGIVAVIAAAAMGYVAHDHLGFASGSIRDGALEVASMVFAFLLIGGITSKNGRQ
jgi:hypothetical protein